MYVIHGMYSVCIYIYTQMDIVGFTQLSSILSTEELVLLLNALYTKIDLVGARIGHVWKVETIGDCLIGVKCMSWYMWIHCECTKRSCMQVVCTISYKTRKQTKKEEYTHISTLMYSYTHVFIHSYIHAFIHSHPHILIHSYTHTLIYSYTQTLIYSYTHTLITPTFQLSWAGPQHVRTTRLVPCFSPAASLEKFNAWHTSSRFVLRVSLMLLYANDNVCWCVAMNIEAIVCWCTDWWYCVLLIFMKCSCMLMLMHADMHIVSTVPWYLWSANVCGCCCVLICALDRYVYSCYWTLICTK